MAGKPKKKNVKKAAKRPAKKAARKPAKRASSARGVSAPVVAATRPVSAAAHQGGIQHYAWRRERYNTLHEFWPFYLHEHSYASNRLLHFVGSSLGLVIAAIAIGIGNYLLLIPALVCGYAFAWAGHFFIEKNRPATFRYPLKSFISDWRMWYTMLAGRIPAEFRKYGIQSR